MKTEGWVVVGIFALAFAELGLMAYGPASLAENKLFFGITTATWTSGVIVVVGYFFGSSKGSAAKDATIATMAASVPSSPPAPAIPPAPKS